MVGPILALAPYLSAIWILGQTQGSLVFGALGFGVLLYVAVAGSVDSFVLQKALKVIETRSGRRVWITRGWIGYDYEFR